MTAINNQAVLVVGAGDYIGAAISKRFARAGYTVCMGRRHGDKLAPVVEAIAADGGKSHGYSLDARDEDQVVDIFARIEKDVAPLDTVIYNVGANVRFSITETTSRVFRKVWEMACFGGFLVGREAAKYMLTRQRGSIFFTGATSSIRGNPGYAAFSSGKFALRAVAQSMARELGPQNIHVAHLIIDAGVNTAWVHERIRESGRDPDSLPEDTLMDPASIGEVYWNLHQQPRDSWTFELDVRPYGERW